MSGTSLTTIKRRMKGIRSLSKATKAMGLMASSQISGAIARMQHSEEYFSAIYQSLLDLSNVSLDKNHVYIKKREVKKTCVVLIGADRGFAGGYHSNLWKEFRKVQEGKDVLVYPIGRKATEFSRNRGLTLVCEEDKLPPSVDKLKIKDTKQMADMLAAGYRAGKWDEIIVVYSHFHGVLVQSATSIHILPISDRKFMQTVEENPVSVLYEPSAEAVLDSLIPQFIFGILYGTVTQAFASETAARKTAMDTANKNADELMDRLRLTYNRMRQEAITQELSEIVGAAKSKERQERV